MAFNIVQTQQEADKFTYKKNQSTVLYTIDTKNINIHGCNVITKTPTAGDVLCVTQRYKQNSDSSGWTLLPPQSQDIVWVKGDTVNRDVWPTETIGDIKIRSIEPVGICYKVRDRKAYVLYGQEVKAPNEMALTKAYRFKADIKAIPSSMSNVHIKVDDVFDEAFDIYRETNLRQFCISVQAHLAQIGGEVSCQYIGPHEYDPLGTDGFYTGNNGIMVLNVKQWNIPNITMYIDGTNITLVDYTCRDVWDDIASHEAQYFHKNNGTYFEITNNMSPQNTSNFDLFYEYVRISGRTLSAQPSSPIDTSNIPINESTWNTANAKIYRDAYGSYKKYVESCMMNLYWGISGATLNRGHKHTQMLAKARYIDPDDGEVKPLYLAPYLCNNVSINAIGLEAGQWWMPSIGELSELFSGTIESNNIDMINSMLNKLGFTEIYTYDSDYIYLSCTPSINTSLSSFNYWHGGSEPEDEFFGIICDDIGENGWPIVCAITAVDI